MTNKQTSKDLLKAIQTVVSSTKGQLLNDDLINELKTETTNIMSFYEISHFQSIVFSLYLECGIRDLEVDNESTLKVIKLFDKDIFDKYKFRTITFEHDFYTREFDDIREKSRKYLKSFGYELVVSNISPNNNNPYEDWWVHPELVDTKIIDNLKSIKEINYCEDWIYNR